MAGHQGFVAGTECVGRFNFPGSAAHVSYFIIPLGMYMYMYFGVHVGAILGVL